MEKHGKTQWPLRVQLQSCTLDLSAAHDVFGRETLQPFRMLHPPKKNEREIRPPKKGTHISIGKCILKTIIFSGDIMLVFRGVSGNGFFFVAGKQFWKESPFLLRFSATNDTNWEVFAFGCLAMVWNHQVYPSVLFAGRRACQG